MSDASLKRQIVVTIRNGRFSTSARFQGLSLVFVLGTPFAFTFIV